MPKLIQKSGYFKPHEKHGTAYMKYIATRDGVEKMAVPSADKPTTEKQSQLIEKILRDYPDAKELFEYEDYLAAPSTANASDFISMALDSHWDEASSSEIYMKYIATRPRVEKHGGHGLFSDGDHTDLGETLAGLSAHGGNVYTFILSLRREDAARLGYDSATAWQALIKSQMSLLLPAPCALLKVYADGFLKSGARLYCLWLYGSPPWDRRALCACSAELSA